MSITQREKLYWMVMGAWMAYAMFKHDLVFAAIGACLIIIDMGEGK